MVVPTPTPRSRSRGEPRHVPCSELPQVWQDDLGRLRPARRQRPARRAVERSLPGSRGRAEHRAVLQALRSLSSTPDRAGRAGVSGSGRRARCRARASSPSPSGPRPPPRGRAARRARAARRGRAGRLATSSSSAGVVGGRHAVAAEHVELPADDPVHRHVGRPRRRRQQADLHVPSRAAPARGCRCGTPARTPGRRCSPLRRRPTSAVTAATTRSGPIEASTTSSAPWKSARSRDAADTSTAQTRAPRLRATATAASPTPPQPMTTTGSPPSHRGPGDDGSVRRGDPASQPRGDARLEPFGQGDEVGLGGVHDDELGERAGVGEAGLALVRADLPCSRPADRAARRTP